MAEGKGWRNQKIMVPVGVLVTLASGFIGLGTLAQRGIIPIAGVYGLTYAGPANADPAVRDAVARNTAEIAQLHKENDEAAVDRDKIRDVLADVKTDTKVIRAILEERTNHRGGSR